MLCGKIKLYAVYAMVWLGNRQPFRRQVRRGMLAALRRFDSGAVLWHVYAVATWDRL